MTDPLETPAERRSYRDVLIALFVAVVFMAGVAYEVAGLTVRGWHTISFYASHSPVLRIAILAAFLIGAVWWWRHSGQVIGR